MGRILAIDYGRKRTGLAVTDPLQIIANALDTVPTHTLMDYVKSYAAANAVDAIVIGMPLQMDGQPSESYTYIRPFVEKLRKEMPLFIMDCFIGLSCLKLMINFLRRMKRRCFNSLHPTPNDTKLRFYMLQSTLLCTGYCSLVTFREAFFVNKVHRKPEN